MSGMPVCKAGIYARLSADFEEKKSESIENQVEMMKQYIRRQNQNPAREYTLVLCGVYSDSGKTGTNFERPGFERMMNDIREGKLDCIIVKDFSRFGRNYIETGNYLEKILPFMKVRFISVCDKYDSFSEDAKEQELSRNIKNLINDAYAKDISAKSRAAKRSAQKRGDYTGGAAPYGYRCRKEAGMRKLEADPEAAGIVRRIFTEYAGGSPMQSIIDGLFRDGIHRISDYRRYHHVYCRKGEILHAWESSSIRALLGRNIYYGDMVQHKYESRFIRGEKWSGALPEEEWITVRGTHPPVISRELFEQARIRLKETKKTKSAGERSKDIRIFHNVFYCGECGRKMSSFRRNGYVYYFCRAGYYKDGRRCMVKGISENRLQAIVGSELSRRLKLSGMDGEMPGKLIREVCQEKRMRIQTEQKKTEEDRRKAEGRAADIFLAYKEGKKTLEDYRKARQEKNERLEYLSLRRKELDQEIRTLKQRQDEELCFLKSLLQEESHVCLNPESAELLMGKIYLYGGRRLEIRLRFQNGRISDE